MEWWRGVEGGAGWPSIALIAARCRGAVWRIYGLIGHYSSMRASFTPAATFWGQHRHKHSHKDIANCWPHLLAEPGSKMRHLWVLWVKICRRWWSFWFIHIWNVNRRELDEESTLQYWTTHTIWQLSRCVVYYWRQDFSPSNQCVALQHLETTASFSIPLYALCLWSDSDYRAARVVDQSQLKSGSNWPDTESN